jgi:uncharacterized phage protein (TIGR01671 family)
MNREIKFRAWHKTFHHFADISDYSCFLTTEGQVVTVGFDDDGDGIFDQNEKVVDDFILTQFTGLKDKNGKEIYEGDILYGGHPLGMETRVVEWENECAEFTTPGFEEEYTIIGNIYENPELLNKTQ